MFTLMVNVSVDEYFTMEESEKLFTKFIKFCEKLIPDTEVIVLMKKNYKRASPTFIVTEAFHSLVGVTTEKMRSDGANMYVHVQEFVVELKAYRAKPPDRKGLSDNDRKRLLDEDTDDASDGKRARLSDGGDEAGGRESRSGTPESGGMAMDISAAAVEDQPLPPPPLDDGVTGDVMTDDVTKAGPESVDTVTAAQRTDAVTPDACQDTATEKSGDPADDTTAKLDDTAATAGGSETDEKKHRASEKQVKKLEKLLKDLNTEIQRLETTELTLDDMGNESNYTLESRYRNKFKDVWNKLCAIKQRAPTTGRATERTFRYEGSRYAEINKRCERFVNKYKTFPDYSDIFDIVVGTNRKFQLRLGKSTMQSLTRDIFTEIGTKLQKRRIKDFAENSSSRLTDNYKSHRDPALHDRELQAKLDANKKLGDNKMNTVFEKYERLQEMGADESESEDGGEEGGGNEAAAPPDDDKSGDVDVATTAADVDQTTQDRLEGESAAAVTAAASDGGASHTENGTSPQQVTVDAQLEETLAEEDVCDLQKSSLRRRLAGEDECKDETTGRRQALAGGDQCKSEPAEQHIESTEKCKMRLAERGASPDGPPTDDIVLLLSDDDSDTDRDSDVGDGYVVETLDLSTGSSLNWSGSSTPVSPSDDTDDAGAAGQTADRTLHFGDDWCRNMRLDCVMQRNIEAVSRRLMRCDSDTNPPINIDDDDDDDDDDDGAGAGKGAGDGASNGVSDGAGDCIDNGAGDGADHHADAAATPLSLRIHNYRSLSSNIVVKCEEQTCFVPKATVTAEADTTIELSDSD